LTFLAVGLKSRRFFSAGGGKGIPTYISAAPSLKKACAFRPTEKVSFASRTQKKE